MTRWGDVVALIHAKGKKRPRQQLQPVSSAFWRRSARNTSKLERLR
jgi:hypothetical protein